MMSSLYPNSYQNGGDHNYPRGDSAVGRCYKPLPRFFERSRWRTCVVLLAAMGVGGLACYRLSWISPRHIQQQQQQYIYEALKLLDQEIDGTVYFSRPEDDKIDGDEFLQASCIYYGKAVEGDQAPLAVIEVATERDVQLSLTVLSHLAQSYHFPFRIRSGGHNKAGFSTVAGGAILSLKHMNNVSVVLDGDLAPMARMGPAVLVQQFLHKVMAKYGYGGVVGYCGTVAEAGFILGGGIGLQSRQHGLGLDNVLGMRIVLADGSLRYVSENGDDPLDRDLFWALRGAGGGSYGVVTELEYRIHKASDRIVYGLLKLEHESDMATFLHRLGTREPMLPRNLMVMHDMQDAASLMWSGHDDSDMDEAVTFLSDLIQELVPSANASIANATIGSWTSMYDDYSVYWSPNVYATRCWYGFLFQENNTQAVWQDIMKHISNGVRNTPSGYLLPDIELWGGAIQDTPPNATAFPYRSALFNVGVLLTIPADDPDAEAIFQAEVDNVNQWWPQVAQYLTGSYVNYPTTSLLTQQDHHYAQVYWGDNLPRLVEIKQRVDPNNIFQFPMSVPIQSP